MADATYITKTYRKQGGDEFVVANSGKISVEPGGDVEIQAAGALSMATGALFNFAGTSLVAEALHKQYLGKHTVTQHASADISSGSVITPAYGYHVYSAATGMSKASAQVPAASLGYHLYLHGLYLSTDANLSLATDSTVGLVLNNRGSDLSSLEISEAGFVDMVCIADGTWQIIGANNITEHASS
jgi:hypothetical protein